MELLICLWTRRRRYESRRSWDHVCETKVKI